jgi:hypothetical protein
MRFILITAMMALVSANAMATVKVGGILPKVTISGDEGGRVDGKSWSSEMIKGKVHVLHYVDPDFRNDNENLKDALSKAAMT